MHWRWKRTLPIAALAFLCAGALIAPRPAAARNPAQAPSGAGQAPAQTADPHAQSKIAAESQALGFLQYLDEGRYAESYAYTSKLLRSKLGQDAFAKEVQEARQSVGKEESREKLNASYTTDLKGQPKGQYVVLQYGSKFTQKPDAVETLVMSFENGYWRVAGWFIK